MSEENPYGLMLGWHPLPRAQGERGQREAVWHNGEGHLITVAPTGAGKGVSCIIPALLSWFGPAIVIDPKGENYAVTARHRRKLGQKVHVLDPFGITDANPRDSLNPLDLIDINSPTAADDAAVIVNLLMQGLTFKHDPFWDERAGCMIAGYILRVLGAGPSATLGDVRALINGSPGEQYRDAMEMAQSSQPDERAAAQIGLMTIDNRVRASIIATAASHIAFVRSGPVQQCLSRSTVSLSDVQDRTPMTVYMVLPPDKLKSHGKLLRLWIGVLLTVLARRRRAPEMPTLFIVDEAAQLGPLDELRSALTLMRGYGVKVWSFWQDLSQLIRTYPLDWQSIVNNCTVQQFFGAASPRAAAQIDEYLVHSAPRSAFQLKPHESLLVRAGNRPEIVDRVDYLTHPLFRMLAAPNPFYAPASPRPPPIPEPTTNVVTFPTREE